MKLFGMEVPTWALIAGGGGLAALFLLSKKGGSGTSETAAQDTSASLLASEFDQRLQQQWEAWKEWADNFMGKEPTGPVTGPESETPATPVEPEPIGNRERDNYRNDYVPEDVTTGNQNVSDTYTGTRANQNTQNPVVSGAVNDTVSKWEPGPNAFTLPPPPQSTWTATQPKTIVQELIERSPLVPQGPPAPTTPYTPVTVTTPKTVVNTPSSPSPFTVQGPQPPTTTTTTRTSNPVTTTPRQAEGTTSTRTSTRPTIQEI